MKTILPESITTVDEAKAFLTELVKNGEHFHPEDDATDFLMFTKDEGEKLNILMDQIYNLKGNDGRHSGEMIFCPCEFILDFK